jgi:hypothetical protein
VVDEERHAVVHLGGLHQVVVVQDEERVRAGRLEVVEEGVDAACNGGPGECSRSSAAPPTTGWTPCRELAT